MISTDNSGVACCGNCGSHVVVACEGGCADPDVQFRDNHIASLPKPQGRELRKSEKKAKEYKPPPAHCSWRECTDPVAPWNGRGRPPRRCAKHVEYMRKYRAKVSA